MHRYTLNGEQTKTNQDRDIEMRAARPDLHALSYDGEISWLFLPIETDRNIYDEDDFKHLPDNLDSCAIGLQKGDHQFVECFWSYNLRMINTNRETVKVSIQRFISLKRYFVVHTSLVRVFDWREHADSWTCQVDPNLQFCVLPKIWLLDDIYFTPEWLLRSQQQEKSLVETF